MYDDLPDPRDGKTPGCSSATNDLSEHSNAVYDDSSNGLNSPHLNTPMPSSSVKKRRVSRSMESVTSRYADRMEN